MPLEIGDDQVSFGRADRAEVISFDAFPALIQSHREHCRNSSKLESAGRDLFRCLLTGTSSDAQVENFVIAVCEWGGDQGEVLTK